MIMLMTDGDVLSKKARFSGTSFIFSAQILILRFCVVLFNPAVCDHSNVLVTHGDESHTKMFLYKLQQALPFIC